ncbi:P1 family peptidase [Mycobacteroides salmoniphilum]|uniref:P1 family peptidase n=1 Tax=Mycobacteroides salmoniphilum TaxID=404941 RepID=UPI000991A8D5|nr:P1 family peptidase [Mycobacteroides salmoniphilum]TDZ81389.1 Peptidase family S58 [Mycobacteroides salmoniphilum]TDZ88889.1 Peptidase family S58 [Mycobacteroides salmoniphilum]
MSQFSGAITDVPGILVGHHQRLDADAALGSGWATGTTVVLAPPGTTGAVDVRGGAPGTRESDLLDPANTVSMVDAIVLSGGSAYGLAAADGVMRWLEERGRGVALHGGTVPIVPGAVIFDLPVGAWKNRPDAEFGYRAAEDANDAPDWGAVGAGVGARAGTLKGGVGSASAKLGNGIVVGAVIVANPVGLVINPSTGLPWDPACAPELGAPPAGQVAALAALPDKSVSLNTTIGVVATNAPLTKAQCRRVAIAAHDGLARAIRPAHTPMDGDTLYVLATGTGEGDAEATMSRSGEEQIALTASVGIAAADCVERAVVRAVLGAATVAGIPAYRDVLPGAFS